MSGDYPFSAKIVSPAKCHEKPWDLWISEIGHLSPRPDDDDAFVAPAPAETTGSASRRVHDAHPYKGGQRYRRSGLHRLRHASMSLHGLFPQMDNLNAAVCHMCGVIVKCSAAYRHLVESHPGTDPLLPPPPTNTTVRNRSRHKKEQQLPPSPVDLLPLKREMSPAHTATTPLSRIVLPHQELQYLKEPSPGPVTGEVQVCMESGELPVVSIQDTEELPLGETLTDDIFAIMNSEGIQSADDITNPTDWKNIIRDIGNLQDINFPPITEQVQSAELYAPALHAYALPEAELAGLQFAAPESAAPKPAPPAPTTPTTKAQARSKSSKTKFNLREYDPNKHCGVVTAENAKPCTRSLTCKAHALSLRRLVEGRSKPFDALLAEHRASREAAAAPAPAPVPAPAPAPAPLALPPLLVNTAIDLSALNGLADEQQVNDIYASLLSVEDPVLPDTSSITSLLSQPPAGEPFAMPEEEPPAAVLALASPARPRPRPDEPPALVPGDVCWYGACPRPLALCTYNASHAGGAVALGKRYATVRSNIKSSLSRSQCKASGATNNFYYGQNALTLSKSVHMNASKSNKPELRKLIVTCSDSGGKVQQTLSELFGGEARPTLNGHVGKRGLKHKAPGLDLGLFDPLLADEKC